MGGGRPGAEPRGVCTGRPSRRTIRAGDRPSLGAADAGDQPRDPGRQLRLRERQPRCRWRRGNCEFRNRRRRRQRAAWHCSRRWNCAPRQRRRRRRPKDEVHHEHDRQHEHRIEGDDESERDRSLLRRGRDRCGFRGGGKYRGRSHRLPYELRVDTGRRFLSRAHWAERWLGSARSRVREDRRREDGRE